MHQPTNGLQSQKNPTRVLVVEDHPVMACGLAALISVEEDFVVCGCTDRCSDVLPLIDSTSAELALVDIVLSDGDGLELIEQIGRCRPDVLLLVYSFHSEEAYADRALRAGAVGYVSKRSGTDQLMAAMRRVRTGYVYLSDTMTSMILSRALGADYQIADAIPADSLSKREREVFEMLGNGSNTLEIAETLGLKKKTVETYREKIKKKLRLKNGHQLIQRAVKWSLQRQGEI